MNNNDYPVPGRSSERNRRIAGHEIGHAFVARALGNTVHSVTIVRQRGYEGRCVRSGPVSGLTFEGSVEDQTQEIISVCKRLATLLQPELGSGRLAEAETILRGQSQMIELMAGAAAEEVLFPDQRSLGARHDQIEARAFARVCVAAQPATKALLQYTYCEARALIRGNRDIVDVLVEALVEFGTLGGAQVDELISAAVAMRAVEKEKQRRVEWRARQTNAAEFAKLIELGYESRRPGVTA